ncbi:predicted protein, partial [Nematostella vectensis]
MYWKLLFGKEMLENVWRSILVDMNKKVKLDNKAFNSPLVSLSDEGFCRLLDFAKGDRPLVVNFGSSTCPIFMKKMLEYEKMIVQFKDVADFVIVYIEEAHPSDGWAFDEDHIGVIGIDITLSELLKNAEVRAIMGIDWKMKIIDEIVTGSGAICQKSS